MFKGNNLGEVTKENDCLVPGCLGKVTDGGIFCLSHTISLVNGGGEKFKPIPFRSYIKPIHKTKSYLVVPYIPTVYHIDSKVKAVVVQVDGVGQYTDILSRYTWYAVGSHHPPFYKVFCKLNNKTISLSAFYKRRRKVCGWSPNLEILDFRKENRRGLQYSLKKNIKRKITYNEDNKWGYYGINKMPDGRYRARLQSVPCGNIRIKKMDKVIATYAKIDDAARAINWGCINILKIKPVNDIYNLALVRRMKNVRKKRTGSKKGSRPPAKHVTMRRTFKESSRENR